MRNYLKDIRSKNEMSQQDVSEATGLTRACYSLIEIGERQKDMSLSIMEKLSAALNVPLDEFIKMEQEYKSEK